MPASKEILGPVTGPVNSDSFFISNKLGAVIQVSPDLGVGETVTVQMSHDNGTTFVNYLDGAVVQLTSTKNALKLYGPALYRVAKTTTAVATGVYLMDLQE